MKIISGKYRGRNFYMPAAIRPTQNLVRKAVFDLVGQDMSGLTVLELFAGSGAVGLEALSLGAEKVTFVERDPKCLETIETNLELLGLKEKHYLSPVCELLAMDAMVAVKHLAQQNRRFDFIFFDPPFGRGLVKKTLKTIASYDILQPASFIVVQHSITESLPDEQERFSLITHRKYGKSNLAIFRLE